MEEKRYVRINEIRRLQQAGRLDQGLCWTDKFAEVR
jgi:hypothetical protein